MGQRRTFLDGFKSLFQRLAEGRMCWVTPRLLLFCPYQKTIIKYRKSLKEILCATVFEPRLQNGRRLVSERAAAAGYIRHPLGRANALEYPFEQSVEPLVIFLAAYSSICSSIAPIGPVAEEGQPHSPPPKPVAPPVGAICPSF